LSSPGKTHYLVNVDAPGIDETFRHDDMLRFDRVVNTLPVPDEHPGYPGP
jgi:hypothetical protein